MDKSTLSAFGVKTPVEDIEIEKGDIHALKAVIRGEADSDQQKRAMDWIIVHACRYYELSQTSDDQWTHHSEGRRFVGWLIVKLSNMRLLRREEEPREQG